MAKAIMVRGAGASLLEQAAPSAGGERLLWKMLAGAIDLQAEE